MTPAIPGAARLQLAVGHAIRSRVAGPDAEAAHARIWGTPGPRWFTETDPIWRVHADTAMFPGGIAALLLQSLHPLAMAGVAGHSGYRSDPWGRLTRTSHYLATVTFGTIEHAEEAIARVRGVHERVRGKAIDGRPYRASDPHLLRWVHVAEVASFLTAYQRFAATPLARAEADEYVAQAGISARLLGVVDAPETMADLVGAVEGYRRELALTAAAADAAEFMLHDPPLPLLARPGYILLARGAVSLLPPWAREMLGLRPWPLDAVAGKVGTRLVRWGISAFDER